MEFIDLHSLFKGNSVIYSILNYFHNSETPITRYKYNKPIRSTVHSRARVRNIISKGPKYRFTSNIDFPKCRRKMAASLNDFSYLWCKRKMLNLIP